MLRDPQSASCFWRERGQSAGEAPFPPAPLSAEPKKIFASLDSADQLQR